MHYIKLLIDSSTFLGLKGGFWFIAFPFISLWVCSTSYLREKEKRDDDIEVENIIINLSKEEKWMLDRLLKSSDLDLDSYIRKTVKSL